MPVIPINSGTGPAVAVDTVGTQNFQVVKIMQSVDGATTALATTIAVSGSMNIIGTPAFTAANVTVASVATGTVNVVNVLSAANITVASVTTGTMNVVNVLSASGITVASLTTGTVNVVNVLSASGVTINDLAYQQGGALIASGTGTGPLIMGIATAGTLAKPIAVSSTGYLYVMSVITMPVLSASGVTIASMTTGTVNVVNVLSASGITVASLTTGTMNVVNVLSASGVTIASITTGTMSIVGSPVYSIDSTNLSTTAGGIMYVGVQSGATTARAVSLTTTGAQHVNVQNVLSAANVTIASITTGTVSVVNVLSASAITIAAYQQAGALIASGTGTGPLIMGIQTGATLARAILLTTTGGLGHLAFLSTGTVNVVNVLSASGVTIASITTGTMTALLAATTGTIGSIVATAHASRFQAFVLATTSAAAGVIVKTSGAHTLYITDLILSIAGSMNVQVCSETTALGQVFLPTTGGFVANWTQPLICTTAQSLRVVLSSSGTCGVTAIGYTVT